MEALSERQEWNLPMDTVVVQWEETLAICLIHPSPRTRDRRSPRHAPLARLGGNGGV